MTSPSMSSMHTVGPLPSLALFVASLAAGCVTDIRSRRVPNALVLWLFATGVGAAWGHWSAAHSLLDALSGTGIGLALWLPYWLLGLLGAGDVKFYAAASTWVGASLAWRAALLAAVLGGLMSIVVLIARRGTRRSLQDIALQLQHADTVIASADVATAEARLRTFPYAVPMAIALGMAAVCPQALRNS